jgi:hypothetical protein
MCRLFHGVLCYGTTAATTTTVSRKAVPLLQFVVDAVSVRRLKEVGKRSVCWCRHSPPSALSDMSSRLVALFRMIAYRAARVSFWTVDCCAAFEYK